VGALGWHRLKTCINPWQNIWAVQSVIRITSRLKGSVIGIFAKSTCDRHLQQPCTCEGSLVSSHCWTISSQLSEVLRTYNWNARYVRKSIDIGNAFEQSQDQAQQRQQRQQSEFSRRPKSKNLFVYFFVYDEKAVRRIVEIGTLYNTRSIRSSSTLH